jgi:hypothetical protein
MLAPKTCPACGSDDLGRGRSRTPWQDLVRDYSPLRRFRCHACGQEGWTARPLPRSRHPAEQARLHHGFAPLGRPAEARDWRARRRNLARLLVTVTLALLLGALAANRLVSCQATPTAPAAE